MRVRELKDSRRTDCAYLKLNGQLGVESALQVGQARMLDGQPGQDEGDETEIKLTKDKCGSRQSRKALGQQQHKEWVELRRLS